MTKHPCKAMLCYSSMLNSLDQMTNSHSWVGLVSFGVCAEKRKEEDVSKWRLLAGKQSPHTAPHMLHPTSLCLTGVQVPGQGATLFLLPMACSRRAARCFCQDCFTGSWGLPPLLLPLKTPSLAMSGCTILWAVLVAWAHPHRAEGAWRRGSSRAGRGVEHKLSQMPVPTKQQREREANKPCLSGRRNSLSIYLEQFHS